MRDNIILYIHTILVTYIYIDTCFTDCSEKEPSSIYRKQDRQKVDKWHKSGETVTPTLMAIRCTRTLESVSKTTLHRSGRGKAEQGYGCDQWEVKV